MNFVENLRRRAVEKACGIKSFSSCWPVWKPEIQKVLGSSPSPETVFKLGQELSSVFGSTGKSDRRQSTLNVGGNAWEALVCYYLNLCLIGSRAVVIKHAKELIPDCISNATTVKYYNFKSNTESDLVGIIFPDEWPFNIGHGELWELAKKEGVIDGRTNKQNQKAVLNWAASEWFSKTSVVIIQCKTNWKDNAQIPMLWDMVYRATNFSEKGITVGTKNYSIRGLKNFKYAFVTVPTNKNDPFTPETTCVLRVHNLSGGNYWGRPSVNGVAESLDELIGRHFVDATSNISIRENLKSELQHLEDKYSYFRLSDNELRPSKDLLL